MRTTGSLAAVEDPVTTRDWVQGQACLDDLIALNTLINSYCVLQNFFYLFIYLINAKNAFFSANERSKGEGKEEEEERKGGGFFFFFERKVLHCFCPQAWK